MKQVLILYSKYCSSSTLKKSEDIYSSMIKREILLCRGIIHDYDAKNNIFTKALFLEKNKWIWKQNVVPKIVHDQSAFNLSHEKKEIKNKIAKNFPFFNSLYLSDLMSNKWKAYLAFRNLCPRTVLIENANDLKKISQLDTEKVILKPLSGMGGKGIKIYSRKKARPIPFPFIAQNLISTTGINGIVNGQHDLRILLANENIFHSFVRIPKKGNLIASLSLGSTIKLVPLSKIPEQVLLLVEKVKSVLPKEERRLYSIDIMLDSFQRPFIIELNSRPGMILEKEELGARTRYYDHLASFFLKD